MGAFIDQLNQSVDPWYGITPQQSAMNAGVTTGSTQPVNPLMQSWGDLGALGKLGVISQGLGAFNSLAQLYSGFKALDLQESQFRFAKKAWEKNYNNQVKDYENTLKDRWAARNASAAARGDSYESMGSWVGSRSLTGEAPGYAASSPQAFYGAGSAQENTPIRKKDGG